MVRQLKVFERDGKTDFLLKLAKFLFGAFKAALATTIIAARPGIG